jgi:hypothetical protein
VRALGGAAVALLLLGPAVVRAQDPARPNTTPTRDVDVVYQSTVSAGDGTQRVLQQRMRWLVEQHRLRVDPPAQGLWMLVDYTTHQLSVVREADRTVMDLPAKGQATLPGDAPAGQFTRKGEDTVAGLACTLWQTMDAAGQPALTCITPDGVLLRAQSNGHTLVEAVKVTYGPQDAEAFQPPAGYTHVTPK